MGRDAGKAKRPAAGEAGVAGSKIGRPGRSPAARVRPRLIPRTGPVATRTKGRRKRPVPA